LGKGDGTFQAAVDFAVPPGCGRMIAADFNEDGKLDLAATNDFTDTVSILLGNGDGTFRAHVDYATGSVPFPIAVGDLNGDGKLDLVVGNAGANTFSVLLGNGDGTFQTHVDYPTIRDPQSVVLADFNGDGKLDLAVFSEGDGTSILLGNGDGTFRHLADYPTGCGSNTNDCTAAVGDLNGDGKLDLAVRNSPANTVSVFLGNGDGTFRMPIGFATGPNPNQVTLGDFNGDGRLDLVAANLNGTTVSVLLQTSGPGAFNFAPQEVGKTGSFEPITLRNMGSGLWIISSAQLDPNYGTGDFKVDGSNCTGARLGPAGTCTLFASFNPTATGLRTAAIDIFDSATPSPQIIFLDGTGVTSLPSPPSAFPVPAGPFDFGSQIVRNNGKTLSFPLTNNTGVALGVSFLISSPDGVQNFIQTNNCGGLLAVGATCTLRVTFRPGEAGEVDNSVEVGQYFNGDVLATNLIKLHGAGLGAVKLSEDNLDLGIQTLTRTGTQTVSLTNRQMKPLAITGVSLTGTTPGDFHQTNTCGSSVPAESSCVFILAFIPTAEGVRTATVTITDDQPPNPLLPPDQQGKAVINLKGVGTASEVSLSTTTLRLGTQTLGTSGTLRMAVANYGSTAASVGGISITGSSEFSQKNTCGSSIAPFSACTISVTFSPTVQGVALATLNVTVGGIASVVNLSGTGVVASFGFGP
jgi:hypothetical protein